VMPYLAAATPTSEVTFVAYQVRDADSGDAVLRVARISPVP